MPAYLVARDVCLLSLTAAAWWLDASLGRQSLPVGVFAGVMTAVTGFLVHEYGHLTASLASGAQVTYPPSALSTLLFHFDSVRSTRRQFVWMSLGGYAATLVAVALIAALAPLETVSGRTALLLAGAGMVVTFVLEVPITVGVLRGGPLPLGAAYRPHE
ncbi:MAG: hypothetical protein JNJ54_14615 [Myxococcaceae bacterium]|nr:hypothetical protein [Myxococcaceae bacterium]